MVLVSSLTSPIQIDSDTGSSKVVKAQKTRPQRFGENTNSKVLAFGKFGGPSCTELRTFAWEVEIGG